MGIAQPYRRLAFIAVCVACLGTSLKADEGDRSQGDVLALAAVDWPCKTDYRPDLAEASPWLRPALLKESTGWRDSADIKALVEAAVTSSRVEMGASVLERFAKGLSGSDLERDRVLTTVFLGLRDEMILYGEMVAFGIMQGVAKAELASGIAKDAKKKGEDGRRTLKEALRIEDDAMDEARFLCRRLDALETKFQVLAEALMRHLTRSSG